MEKAAAAVSKFMSKSGHHDTTVHESIAPAVTKETVKPTQHESVTTAIDKEVHQDHYHTAVQPVRDTQVLPEQHHHNVVPVEKREFHHGRDEHVKEKLAETAAGFKDTRTVAQTAETKSAAPVVAGEHVHHHVHQTIQPVIERETIQPHVVHTTVPIHEVHHKDPKHHQVTSLPAVDMAEFKKHEGGLSGRGEHVERFDGQPKTIGSAGHGLAGRNEHSERPDGQPGTMRSGEHGLAGRGEHGDRLDGQSRTVGSGEHGGLGHNSHVGNDHDHDHDKHGAERKHKPSLKEKLDPRIDADGDGKAGFMS